MNGFQGVQGSFPLNVDPIAIGIGAGNSGQSLRSIAVGTQAGWLNQGAFSIALGFQAGFQSQSTNSIVINASGSTLNAGNTGFFVNPIRFNSGLVLPGAQGNQGVQGLAGTMGPQGGVTGPDFAVQFNKNGSFGGSSNLTFNDVTNVFTAGAGTPGGGFQVIGSFVQGATASRPAGNNARLGYVNNGKYMEVLTNGTTITNLDWHSIDTNNINAYDARISCVGGSGNSGLAVDGGGLVTYTARRHTFTSTEADGDAGFIIGIPAGGFAHVGSYMIGTNTTSSPANVNVQTAGNFLLRVSTSSQKYKRDIVPYDKGLVTLVQLEPKYYYSKNEDETQRYAGLIAEQVHALGLTEFVGYDGDGEPQSVYYSHMMSLAVNAIKDLKAIVDQQNTRIQQLESEVASIKSFVGMS